MNRFAVELRNISKSFGKNIANDDVSIAVPQGTIHGIVGENGAGKSTIMKVLFGLYQPDRGEIFVDGEKRHWHSTKDASAAGIGMVHQHFMLSHRHSTLDNIILGVEPSSSTTSIRAFQPIDRKHARVELRVIMKMFDLQVDLDAKVATLPVGVQQRIEILKVLYRKARVLILDEPTAVLTPQETSAFLFNLKKLRDEGKTIIIITHKLQEILSCADDISVMRAGKLVGCVAANGLSEEALATMMVGRAVRLRVEPPPMTRTEKSMLTVKDLSWRGPQKSQKLTKLSFEVHGGEILGVAGVDGNGQHELLEALSAPSSHGRLLSGDITIQSKSARRLSNLQLRQSGVAFIPPDRLRDGILAEQNAFHNFALGHHFRKEFATRGLIRWGAVRRACQRAMTAFDVRPPNPWTIAGDFSGGNQQKLIFARELNFGPSVIIAANPTRGVDVGSIEFIHDQILAARQRGCAVLLVSSELSEVMGLSDRIIVLYRGAVAGELSRKEFDHDRIGCLMGRGTDTEMNSDPSPKMHAIENPHSTSLPSGPVVDERED